MANFDSAYERNKWKQIELGAKESLERLKGGQAGEADFKKISGVLDQYDQLARSVFDTGVDSIHDAATKVMDTIKSDREAKGKPPLSEAQHAHLFELAVERQLFEFGPDLVETIQSMLDKQSSAFEDTMSAHAEKTSQLFNSFTKPSPAEEQKDDQLEDKEKQQDLEDMTTDEGPKSLYQMIKRAFKDTLKEAKDALGFLSDVPTPDVEGYAPGQMRFVSSASNDEKAEGQRAETEEGSVPASLSGPEAKEVAQEVDKSRTTMFQSFIDKLNNLLKGKSDEDLEKDEQKKADTWWRSFMGWAGNTFKKAKDVASSSWVSTMLKGLGLALLAPKFFENVIKKVGEIFTVDNVVAAGKWVWDQIVDKGPKVLKFIGKMALAAGKWMKDLVVNAFEWSLDKIRTWLPSWLGGYSEEEKKKKAAQPGGPMADFAKGPTMPEEGGAEAGATAAPGGTPSAGATTPAAAAPAPTTPTTPTKDVSGALGGATPASPDYSPAATAQRIPGKADVADTISQAQAAGAAVPTGALATTPTGQAAQDTTAPATVGAPTDTATPTAAPGPGITPATPSALVGAGQPATTVTQKGTSTAVETVSGGGVTVKKGVPFKGIVGDTTEPAAPEVSGATRSLTGASGVPTGTQVVPETEVAYKPGLVTEAPQPAKAAPPVGAGGSKAGANKVGIGSFTIASGVDDSLPMMNLGLVS